ncbi:MAG: hypothetical protein KAH77_05190 [Thiomargarita sp.]|nr:hypothetical protein [Thiomargarita sp.]
MTSTISQLAYPELIDNIQRLSTEGESGTIFITSHDGHLARIVLTQGNISHLVFDSKYRGSEAISHLQTLTFARLQFVEGVFESAPDAALPNTKDIFKTLIHGGTVTPETSPRLSNFDAAIEHIKKSLAHHVGPFAVLVCDEHIDKVGGIRTIDDIFGMIDAIAVEIHNPEASLVFKEEMKTEIVTKWT